MSKVVVSLSVIVDEDKLNDMVKTRNVSLKEMLKGFLVDVTDNVEIIDIDCIDED